MQQLSFTLIEVIAAVTLVSLLVVGLMEVRGRLIRQSQHASLVAKANVLGGYLVGAWTNESLKVDIGRDQEGIDSATNLFWQINCSRHEVEPGIFLKCLKVRIYAKANDQDAIVVFEAWKSFE
jgi:hypothetical protein